ncbi:GNAT family N-acetyltransferase [Pseudodonghicola flavimaris]|uniref:GNAT family N-acetyltransferase n=1 Tax=Pseudodonghicola flavimaris TaxID=3050036 RepID=A0ABT7EVJ1_9RHOB|nr:GNAT family N-acetyltransferase [Pseudodonghicola flavimaris]MDK3016372.1 GNAT family N-acetyltransferase [Pseudodonghicola flavimaris]
MSAALHLARPADLDRLLALSAACHAELGIDRAAEQQRDGIAPLLEGLPQGAIYLIGPARAPLGYIVLSFGWSLPLAGLEARIEELYIRPPVRGRGIATEVLGSLPRALGAAGVKAIQLHLDSAADRNRDLFARARFREEEGTRVMSRKL